VTHPSTLLSATVPEDFPLQAGQCARCRVVGTDVVLVVHNIFSTDIPRGKKVVAGFLFNEERWVAIAADL
jgi:hypothetical protein